jgi:hypothetical protein
MSEQCSEWNSVIGAGCVLTDGHRGTCQFGDVPAANPRYGHGGLPLPFVRPFEASFLAASEQLQHSATLLVTHAVVDWATKLGLTPERWLELYEPVVTLMPWQPGEDSLTLKLSVTAKERLGAHSFTVKA